MNEILIASEVKQDEIHIEKIVHIPEKHERYCSCVDFVRHYRPDLPSKNASEFRISTTTPREGAVALMYYPNSTCGILHSFLITGKGGCF